MKAKDLVTLLTGISGISTMACGAYCLIWFKPLQPSFLGLDIAVPCWLYCATLHPAWGAFTLVSALLPLMGAVMVRRGMNRLGPGWIILSGIILLPVGVLSIIGGLLAAGHAGRIWPLAKGKA